MTAKTQISTSTENYSIEVWNMSTINGFIRFGVQIFSRSMDPQIASYSMRLAEEFVEDELDNKKDKEYLEKLALSVVKDHINDIRKMSKHTVAHNLKYWFNEAKRKLDQTKETNN